MLQLHVCDGHGIGLLLVSPIRELCIASSGTSSMYIMARVGSVDFWSKMTFKDSTYSNWLSSVKMINLIVKEDSIAVEENNIATPMAYSDLPMVHAPGKHQHYMKRWEDAMDNL